MPQETQGQTAPVQGQTNVVQGDNPTPQQTNATPQSTDATPKPKVFTEAEVQEQVNKARQSVEDRAKEWRTKANQVDALQKQIDVLKLELDTPYPTDDSKKFAEQLRSLKLELAQKEADIAKVNAQLASYAEKEAEAQRISKAHELAQKHNVEVDNLLEYKTEADMYMAIAEGKVTRKVDEKMPHIQPINVDSSIKPTTADDFIKEGLKQKRKK